MKNLTLLSTFIFLSLQLINTRIYKFKTPKIILFGDSEFEFSFSHGIGSILTTLYGSRVDIINRGLGGFNSKNGLEALNDLIKMKDHFFTDKENPSKYLVIIMFGDNDCSINYQHVGLEEYAENLKSMVTKIRALGSNYEVVLMTPVPIHDQFWEETCQEAGRPIDRFNVDLQLYRQEMIKVSRALKVHLVDIWCDAWKSNSLYNDGLHPNSFGYSLMTEMLIKYLKTNLPNWHHDNIKSPRG